MAKKMTKAQARKRLLEARTKISKVYLADNIDWSTQERGKMYDICIALGRYAKSGKLK
jgi:hypothetical protein